MTRTDPEKLARMLEEHEDYRVIRRLQRVDRYCADDPGLGKDALRLGIFLDVETTGLDASTDHVIELALVPFEFASDGRIFRVHKEYDGLRDPGVAIPPEVVRLTGITDQMVSGQSLDLDCIVAMVRPAHLLVAHNAAFDRPFVEPLDPVFTKKAWACSLTDVPWQEEGLEGGKLDYLAYRYGFFYESHRATGDCLAGIHLLSQDLPTSGRTALDTLLENARRKTMRLWAEGSPYESKDLLKARGYRWNNGDDGRPKAWFRDVPESELADELRYLERKVYGGRLPDLRTDTINAFNRYSVRV